MVITCVAYYLTTVYRLQKPNEAWEWQWFVFSQQLLREVLHSGMWCRVDRRSAYILGGKYCLHLQGQRVSQLRSKQNFSGQHGITCQMLVPFRVNESSRKSPYSLNLQAYGSWLGSVIGLSSFRIQGSELIVATEISRYFPPSIWRYADIPSNSVLSYVTCEGTKSMNLKVTCESRRTVLISQVDLLLWTPLIKYQRG
jgi:hypothetical protein